MKVTKTTALGRLWLVQLVYLALRRKNLAQQGAMLMRCEHQKRKLSHDLHTVLYTINHIMTAYFIRFIKRALVLLPGLAVALLAAKEVYPLLDRRVPAELAILITYVISAYVLIPGVIRMIRLVVRPKHIPLYCVTPDGFASDPINIGLIGTQRQIIEAMRKAGWHLADKRTLKSLFKMGLSIVLKKPYPTAPFSSLYLFGRRQDLGFELPLDNNPQHRHHVRFWLSEPKISEQQREHLRFWQRHGPLKPKPKQQLWVGAASLDTGLAFIRHNAQLTHMINPDTNAERDLIVQHLRAARQAKKTRQITLGQPYKLRNRVWRGYLHTDGKMTIVELKNKRLA
jgi:hypothetical protein